MLNAILIGKLPKRDIRVYDYDPTDNYIYFVYIVMCESSVV